jgi:hypothetical protein
MTTAYYGVILTSLFSLTICVYFLKNKFEKNIKTYGLLAYSFLLAFGISSSNTLYDLQFLLPLILVIFIAYLLSIISLKKSLFVIAPQILGSILGVVCAKLFLKSLFAPAGALENYFHLKNIGQAAIFFYKSGATALSTHSQKIELIVISCLFVVAGILFLFFIKSYTKKTSTPKLRNFLRPESFVVLGVSAVVPFISIAGAIGTGNTALRYLLLFAIFPYLSVITVSRIKFKTTIYSQKIIAISLVSLILTSVIVGLMSNPYNTFKSIEGFKSETVRCVEDSLKNTLYRHGVAGFGRARSIALNNNIGVDVVQLTSNLKQYNWLFNHGKYQHYDADFIIAEKDSSNYTDISASVSGAALLADSQPNIFLTATNVYSCPGFDIYTYSKTNPSRGILNGRLRINPDKPIH